MSSTRNHLHVQIKLQYKFLFHLSFALLEMVWISTAFVEQDRMINNFSISRQIWYVMVMMELWLKDRIVQTLLDTNLPTINAYHGNTGEIEAYTARNDSICWR